MKYKFLQIPHEFSFISKATPTDASVWSLITFICNSDSEKTPRKCFVTNRSLANTLGKSIRTINRSITNLEDLGLLTRTMKPKPNGDFIRYLIATKLGVIHKRMRTGTLPCKPEYLQQEGHDKNDMGGMTKMACINIRKEYNKKKNKSFSKEKEAKNFRSNNSGKFSNKKNKSCSDGIHCGVNHDQKKKKTNKRNIKARCFALKVFRYWNEQPALTTHGLEAKSVKKALSFLEKKYGNPKYELDSLKQAIADYNSMLDSKSPIYAYRIQRESLLDFLVLNRFQRIKLREQGKKNIAPYYDLIRDDPDLFSPYVTKAKPKLVKALKLSYEKNILGERQTEPYNAYDELLLQKAAIHLEQFMKKGRLDRFDPGTEVTVYDYIQLVFYALEDHFGDKSKISLLRLSGAWVYTHIVPRYMTSRLKDKQKSVADRINEAFSN